MCKRCMCALVEDEDKVETDVCHFAGDSHPVQEKDVAKDTKTCTNLEQGIVSWKFGGVGAQSSSSSET